MKTVYQEEEGIRAPGEREERRRGRQRLRRLDCIKRDIKKAEVEDEDWMMFAPHKE